jgi:hypothetical protein
MGPYARAEYNLTMSHRRLQSPAFHPNDNEFRQMFPQLFKNGTTNRRTGEYQEGGLKGCELALCLGIYIL